MSSSFFESDPVSSLGGAPASCGLCPGVAIRLFVQISEKHVTAEIAILNDAGADGEGDLRRTLDDHYLSRPDNFSQAVTGSPKTFADIQGLPYFYRSVSNDSKKEKVRAVLFSSPLLWFYAGALPYKSKTLFMKAIIARQSTLEKLLSA